ncbi:MAG: hypothetical protein ACK4F4_07335 [Hylemonella sp.]|uniref:hypothetical protein n=1 Tax=Hylemonella sp. TaxID=2066020 RepID=UPI00391C62B7
MTTEKQAAPLFIMAQAPRYTWPVKVPIPEAGKYKLVEFMATFPNLNDQDLDRLIGNDDKGMPRYTTQQIAEQALLTFEPLPLPDGSYVEPTEEGKARLLAMPRVPMAVMQTFIRSVKGLAAEKND